MSTPNIDHEALIIAYLSGQASNEQIKTYQKLFESDNSFRQAVKDVELWLAPLNEDTPDMEPPAGLLESILAEISPPKLEAIASPTPLFEDEQHRPSSANDNSATKWKVMTAVASVLAIAAFASHFLNMGPNLADKNLPAPNLQVQNKLDQGQQFLALLSDQTQPELVAIIYNPSTGTVVARLSNITVPEDGDLQLWLIREGEASPLSLGVMERARENNQLEFDIPMTLQGGTDILAISLEQKGGSLSSGPEGPVLFTGAVAPLKRDI